MTAAAGSVRLAATAADRAAAHALRYEVFTVEQGVPVEIERDDKDETAVHAVAERDGRVVGTGRLVARPDGVGVVGRMAVRAGARGAGVGAGVLRALEAAAQDRGLHAIELHAQATARRFYARAGYTEVGDEYTEAGLLHIDMVKPLPVVRPGRDADGPALTELIGGCWADYPGCVLDVDAEEPWLRAPATAYAAVDGRLWVAELAGSVVGCAGFRDGELKSMYVAAAARRSGLGGHLLRLVEAEARRRGADRLALWSDRRFTTAHAFYERHGYVRLPETRDLHDLSDTTELRYLRQL